MVKQVKETDLKQKKYGGLQVIIPQFAPYFTIVPARTRSCYPAPENGLRLIIPRFPVEFGPAQESASAR